MKHISLIPLLQKQKNPTKARVSQSFFKTGKGQYGEGDIFWGITVPEQRVIARQCLGTSLEELGKLIQHPVHEVRLTSLLVLTEQYKRATAMNDEALMKNIFDFYIAHAQWVNNWDLVDTSAPIISGHYFFTHPKKQTILRRYVKSGNIWERRIAIISTFYFIRQKELQLTFELADALMFDTQDLIHKAAGWMLREAGKKDEQALVSYLNTRYTTMPRTMLRYAIERFPEAERKRYLAR